MRLGTVRLYVSFLLAATAGSSVASGQIVSGTIVGNVHDESGAIVANTQVTVRNLETNQTRQMVANETGAFTFATLSPGRYRVSASHPGFKSTVTSDIELQIDQTARVEMTLQVGQVTEEVTVNASAAVLQTDTATMGQVIAERPVNDLPLNGRNFLQLASLSAGVVPATASSNQASRLGRSGLTAHVGGGRGSANSFLIDGVESRGARLGEISMLPSPDSIREFKIQRNYYSAEYGDNPGIISVSIKSGTNALHGTLYEYLRNSALDSAQFFDQGRVAPFRQNQFGANVGGPVLRDRTFFFFAYDGQRRRRSNQAFAVVPDPKNLTGNFAGLVDAGRPLTITDPFNNNAPFPNNQIPAARLSKVAAAFNQFIPAPNLNVAQGNYGGNPTTLDDFNQYHVKVDHRFSARDSMFGRYSISNWSIVNQGLLPYSGSSLPLNSRNAVLQETHIVSPSAVNTVKLSFNRDIVANGNEAAADNLAVQMGFKNLSVASYDYSLPRFTVTGFTQMGHSQQTFHQWTNAYILSDTFAIVRGSHNFTAGGDIRVYRSPQSTTNGTNGRMTVSNIFTGYSVADYLLGTFQQATAYTSLSTGDFRYRHFAAFLQDDYKVSKRLTLNLGLRWEYATPWRELGGSEGYFDQSAGVLRLAKNPSIYGLNINSSAFLIGGVRPGVYEPNHRQFAPRIGMAFKVNDKTVIRSGYGIFYITNQGSHTIEISVNPGAAITVTSTNTRGQTPRLLDSLFDSVTTAAVAGGGSLQTINPVRHPSYMQQWNFNIQRELPGNMLAEVGYVGSNGMHLIGTLDVNAARLNRPGENLAIQARRPYPNFAFIQQFGDGEKSSYNALLATIERRFSKGLSLMASYTFSKSIDTGSAGLNDAQLHAIPTNRNNDRGLSGYDARNRLAFNGIWELPFGANKRYLANTPRPVRWLATGWQANTIVQFQSGLPFSVIDQGDIYQTGVQAMQRPNRVGDGNLPVSQRKPDQWFDLKAFVLNATGTYGNAGRNILFQNGTKNVDLSVFKSNYFGERKYNLQFRAEFFNIMNDTNFDAPANAINGPKFGVVSTTGPAREIQFALKFTF